MWLSYINLKLIDVNKILFNIRELTCPQYQIQAQLVMSDPSLSELTFLQPAANSDGV